MGKSLHERATDLARIIHQPRAAVLAELRRVEGLERRLKRQYPGDPDRVRRELALDAGIDPEHFIALCKAPQATQQQYTAEATIEIKLAADVRRFLEG